MTKYTTVSGREFTDADIAQWADAAEREYTGGHVGPSRIGRPRSVGADARPFTLRLDGQRRAKIHRIAQERDMTASQLMRELIDQL